MNTYKLKSAALILVILVFMVGVGYFVNDLHGTVTGAVVGPVCKCIEDSDCNDNNPCTEDICLYKDTCEAAICINRDIPNCG
ncbi:hypothetical protein KY331_01135 [Candidatus Woesearchaeota archaeon]|nr:hypothetical protein [Candidatus Woesearchaeota archaeon]